MGTLTRLLLEGCHLHCLKGSVSGCLVPVGQARHPSSIWLVIVPNVPLVFTCCVIIRLKQSNSISEIRGCLNFSWIPFSMFHCSKMSIKRLQQLRHMTMLVRYICRWLALWDQLMERLTSMEWIWGTIWVKYIQALVYAPSMSMVLSDNRVAFFFSESNFSSCMVPTKKAFIVCAVYFGRL